MCWQWKRGWFWKSWAKPLLERTEHGGRWSARWDKPLLPSLSLSSTKTWMAVSLHKAADSLSILLTTTYDHMLQTKLTYHNIVHMPACCTAVYTSALSTLGVIATFLLIFLAYFNLVSACTSIPSSGAEFCRLHTTTQQEYEGGYGEALWFSLNMRKTSFKMRNRVLPRVAQLPYCRRQI